MASSFLNFTGRLVLAASLVAASSLAALAQGVPGNGGTTGGPPGPATTTGAVPLDGGTSLLLASGVAYGLRRLRQRRLRA